VNPSGRIPDTYARDFKKAPTWFNFGNNLIPNGQDYLSVQDKKSTYIYSFVDYEEGIYVGYRYYETRGFTDVETWYNENVVFPFGYGLSYTTFSQEITNKQALQNTIITADKTIIVNVKVTNTGSVAGKDVVQLYVTPPYIEGGIEKSHVVLAGFAKTGIIQPGASETVTVEIDPYYFASYDYNDKNQNGFKGYELESGKYIIRLCANAHEQIDSFEATVQEPGIKYETDPVTGYSVVNRFDDIDDELGSILSRTDWGGTFPATRTTQERELDALTNQKINSIATNNPFQTNEFPIIGEENDVTLRDLVGKDYDDPLWDKLLNRLKVNDMINLFNNGAFQTAAIMEIGKPRTNDADGPAGFVNFMSDPSVGAVYGTSHYACEPIMAATWNVDLLFDFGEAIGNEALIGDERGDGTPYSGWYAPGINLHRSPFGGRAGEYFSEDSFLSGMLAAYEIQGAMSKGVYTQVKHFAVNEQETSRRGICTWLDEQTLREIYLRPFEMAVKIGKTRGMMSSFNRIGAKWTGGDYRLLTEVLRNEWGFRGMVICDFNTGSHMDSRQMAYAGGDLNLQTFNQEWKPKKSDPTDMTILRERVKNILYTVCNSNAMNSEVLGYKPPVWMVLMFIIDAVVVAGLGLWGFFAIRKAYKAQKQKTS
ncbi:MAG: beta-glucosidase, partial [Clostridiales bacterium]|nr:beta-glucosidase [Clostridiales bacterium]